MKLFDKKFEQRSFYGKVCEREGNVVKFVKMIGTWKMKTTHACGSSNNNNKNNNDGDNVIKKRNENKTLIWNLYTVAKRNTEWEIKENKQAEYI